MNIATINVPGLSAADLTASDHRIAVDVKGATVTTSIDGAQVDQRTLTGDQLRASGTVGFASGGSGVIRSARVESPNQPTFATTFAGYSNPFEAGVPTGSGITLVSKDVMLPIANPEPVLRRAFTTGGAVISRARLYVTGGGYQTMWVNGEPVTVDGQPAADPAAANLPHLLPDHTNEDKTILYNTFDVTGLVKSGSENVLAAELGRGWYGVTVPDEWYWQMTNYHGDPRVLARLVIDYADGTSQTIDTDHNTWKAIDGPTTFDSVYTGEKYDARIAAALGSWQKPGYDDSAWSAATRYNVPGSCPQGACVGTLPDTGALPSGFVPAKLRAQENQAVHVYDVLHPVAITETAPDSDVWIFDMGNDRSQLVAGWARIHLSGVTPDKAGMTIRFRQDEALTGAGTTASPLTLSENNGFVDGNFQTDYYTLSNAPTQTWAAKYRYGGTRYLEVRGLSAVLGRAPSLAQDSGLFTVEAVTSTIRNNGTFSSNNALLQRIFRNSNYAEWNNYVHKPNDTPAREKNGWTGDAFADSEAGLVNTDALAFMRKWVRDMPDSLISTGEFSEIVPAAKGGYGYDQTPGWNNTFGPTPAWDAAFFAIPDELYRFYGETDLLREIYPAQKKFMDYYAKEIPASNGYTKILGGNLNDYQPPAGANNQAVINQQLYYYFADYMARMGKLLGRDDDAATYRALADDILRVFISKYWDTTTHSFRKGTVNNLETQNAMGLAYDMVPGSDLPTTDPRYLAGEQTQAANKLSVAATIANDIVSRTNHFGAGLMGLRYVYNILDDYGYKDIAYRMVTQVTNPSWGDLIARGNTALTESWGAASGDHHYMSQVLTWFYQDVAGIRAASPGYRTVTVKPFVPTVTGTSDVPTSVNQTGLASSLLDNVDASVQTPQGKVSSKWWRRDDGRVAMVVTVPSNTPTDVWVPTFDKPVDTLPSAHFVRNDLVGTEPYAVYSVAGGSTYLFNLSTSTDGGAGGTVPATLSLTLGAPATFGAFVPGVDRSYDASTTANVISTAGDATLSVTDPSTTATGRLLNGSFALSEPLQARANSGAFAPPSTTAGSPLTLLTYSGPISNDAVTIGLRQHIGATQALRTGAYSKTLTFTLSTTTP